MENKLRLLLKNKQNFIALFILFVMAFNACSDSAGSGSVVITTPEYGYVDSNGNITEKDSGRTVVVADKKAKAVFYSDNLASDAQRVGFAYEGKTMIFFFGKNQNFPTSIVLFGSGEAIYGIFTPYNSGTQTYSLTVEQGGDQATLSDISLSKNIFTQYKDDPGFNSSQNLRMRNLHTAMCIYKSIDAFIASDKAHQARGLWNGVNKVLQIFFPSPIAEIVVGAIGFYSEANSFMSTSNPFTMKDNISGLVESTNLIINGINKLFPSSGSSSGGSTFVAVTGITGVPTSGVAGTPIALSGTVVPSNATSKTIVWSVKSAGTTGATISGNTLTTKAAGTVIVTATIDAAVPAGSGIFGDIPVFNPYTKDFYITITSAFVPVTGITGVPTGGIAGTSIALSGIVAPDNATNKAIVWSVKSAGTTGATISGNTLTTTAAGTVTVTATIANGKTASTPYTQDFSITITNNFVAVTGITGVPTGGTAGTPVALSGTVAPDNATNKAIVWSVKSAGTTGATISGNTLTTTAAGTVTVTATIANGKTASTPYTQDFTITVTTSNTFVAVTGITGVPSTASVGAFDLAGTVAPANASNQIIVWTVKSSGTTGARINGNTLTTTAAGTVTVTGTIANGKAAGTPFTQDFAISITGIANTYTVTFNKNNTDTDSTEADPLTKTVTEPASRIDKLPTQPVRKGYTFNGWNTQANGSGTSFTATTNVTSNTTVYAQWTGITYTVTFNKNNTDAGSTEANPLTRTVTVPATTISSLPTQPTRPGYTFNGWNTQANGSGTSFTATTNVTSNTTVYAQWMLNPINIAPTDLSARSYYLDSEKIGRCNLSWSRIPGATGYYIYRSLSASGTYDKIATITEVNYSDYMPAGTVYYYKVSAFNSLGEGPVSSYMPWIVLATPENVRVYFEVVTSDRVLATVSWSPVPGATEYMVYWSYSVNNGGMSGMSEFTTSKSHWFDRNTTGYFEIEAVAVFTNPYVSYSGNRYRIDFTLP